eukprot:CAMPEP_0177730852 /NCGR_PEP_ID=MMETSP0484_2-20121128/22218_1 /TAXON_ID=354590 /ORGANISM="Rhodomonas lens, Strain RHODO" /LENGTH=279 /DNA_ID=CAMNT_0019243885 /DNA_START=155 /DNA_END=991 /DNA_ORIENTATION=+
MEGVRVNQRPENPQDDKQKCQRPHALSQLVQDAHIAPLLALPRFPSWLAWLFVALNVQRPWSKEMAHQAFPARPGPHHRSCRKPRFVPHRRCPRHEVSVVDRSSLTWSQIVAMKGPIASTREFASALSPKQEESCAAQEGVSERCLHFRCDAHSRVRRKVRATCQKHFVSVSERVHHDAARLLRGNNTSPPCPCAEIEVVKNDSFVSHNRAKEPNSPPAILPSIEMVSDMVMTASDSQSMECALGMCTRTDAKLFLSTTSQVVMSLVSAQRTSAAVHPL